MKASAVAAAAAIPAKAQSADAPAKRAIYRNSRKPAKTPRMNSIGTRMAI